MKLKPINVKDEIQSKFIDRKNPALVALEKELSSIKDIKEVQRVELINQAKQGSLTARNKVLKSVMKFVFAYCRKFDCSIDLLDLFQIGMMSVNDSIDRFDESYKVKFISFAVYEMHAKLQKEIFNFDDIVKTGKSKETEHEREVRQFHEETTGEKLKPNTKRNVRMSEQETYLEDEHNFFNTYIDLEYKDRLETIDRYDYIRNLIDTTKHLNSTEKEIIISFHYDNFSIEAIAYNLQYSKANIYILLKKSYKVLKRLIKER